MKFIVFLNGLLLLFLLHHWTESMEEPKMNLTSLAQIIDFFEQNYNDKEDSYAVAINVPMNHCQGNFDPSNKNFLTQDKNAKRVRNAIFKSENQFYKGEDLMAAGKCNCKISVNCTSKSVYVLLQNDSCLTFKNFLQRRKNDSCVVIYTVYSPCQNILDNRYDILPNLEILKNHAGIKAFVFKKSLAENFTEIVRRVPFYRFVNKTVMPITN